MFSLPEPAATLISVRRSTLIYSTMTDWSSARSFFRTDPLIDTLKAFRVFFIGFVARPIGAAIFGHYGDRIGRKATLIVTLVMTGIATAAVGWSRAPT